MRKSSLLILTTLLMAFLSSCAQENADNPREPSPESDSTTVTPSQTAELELIGVEAYEMACESCHGLGLNGAPATADVDAWSERSVLWEAVLFNHAKNGYLGMPSKGGKPERSDRRVVAAALYFLFITYPYRLTD
jgi:cytochrome c5